MFCERCNKDCSNNYFFIGSHVRDRCGNLCPECYNEYKIKFEESFDFKEFNMKEYNRSLEFRDNFLKGE